MTERDKLLVDNLPLVGWFALRRLPAWLRRLAGGWSSLVADLMPAYLHAVDKWLSTDRHLRLSTYVCKGLHWSAYRLALSYPIIRVHAAPLRRIRNEHRRRRMARVEDRTVRFGLKAARCQDRAMLRDNAPPVTDLELADAVTRVFRTLTMMQRLVLELRFGLGGLEGESYTLDEAARVLRVTRERVRQVEAKALAKLQDYPRCLVLERFLERGHDDPTPPTPRPPPPPTEFNFWLSRFKLPQ